MTATLDTSRGRATLRFERELRHAQDRVWRAITDPAELRAWFPAEVIYDQRAGAPMQFDFGGAHDIDAWPGRGPRVGPAARLRVPVGEDTLRFELAPAAAGTRLVFTHAFDHEPGKPARDAAGWEACFEAFDALLDGASKTPGGGDWSGHHERYLARFGDLTIDEQPVRLRGPYKEVDGRAAVDVTVHGSPAPSSCVRPASRWPTAPPSRCATGRCDAGRRAPARPARYGVKRMWMTSPSATT